MRESLTKAGPWMAADLRFWQWLQGVFSWARFPLDILNFPEDFYKYLGTGIYLHVIVTYNLKLQDFFQTNLILKVGFHELVVVRDRNFINGGSGDARMWVHFLLHAGVLGSCPCADEGSPVSFSCPHQLEARSSPVKRLKGCGNSHDYFLGITFTDFCL